MSNQIDLAGAAVAITGAARGIGYATAKAFIAKGANVYIGDLDADLAKSAAAELGCTGAGWTCARGSPSRSSSPGSTRRCRCW